MRLLTSNDIMERLRIGRSTLYKMIKEGQFPQGIKMGASVRWTETDVNKWIADLAEQRTVSD